MKCNMGLVDRIVRLIAAIVFGLLYYYEVVSGPFGIVLLVIGGTFIITSAVGYCPLYVPLRISTVCSKPSNNSPQ
ncbi:MAG: DUF2892 domain-containing protein [Bacteroidetes bacterium]|nr:DUF2892 domain-containing protein [Bacteroidota bacterium]